MLVTGRLGALRNPPPHGPHSTYARTHARTHTCATLVSGRTALVAAVLGAQRGSVDAIGWFRWWGIQVWALCGREPAHRCKLAILMFDSSSSTVRAVENPWSDQEYRVVGQSERRRSWVALGITGCPCVAGGGPAHTYLLLQILCNDPNDILLDRHVPEVEQPAVITGRHFDPQTFVFRSQVQSIAFQ